MLQPARDRCLARLQISEECRVWTIAFGVVLLIRALAKLVWTLLCCAVLQSMVLSVSLTVSVSEFLKLLFSSGSSGVASSLRLRFASMQ